MPKLKSGFTLFEILIVIAIVGIVYSLVFMPLSYKFDSKKKQDNSLLSITTKFNNLKQNSKHYIFSLECSTDFKECYFYDNHNKKIADSFALDVKAPKKAYILDTDGAKIVWQNSIGNFRLVFNNSPKEFFIQDEDGIYKIGAIAKNNFIAQNRDDAIEKSRMQIATSMDMLAK